MSRDARCSDAEQSREELVLKVSDILSPTPLLELVRDFLYEGGHLEGESGFDSTEMLDRTSKSQKS